MITRSYNVVFDLKQVFLGNDDVVIKLKNYTVYSIISCYGTFGPNEVTISTGWVTWFRNDFLTYFLTTLEIF